MCLHCEETTMSNTIRYERLKYVLYIAVASLNMGQTCSPQPNDDTHNGNTTNFTVVSACGLLATECFRFDGANPVMLASADFDLDGDIDLLVGNTGTDNADIILNQGDGHFTAGESYPLGGNVGTITVGDLMGNGMPNAFVAAGDGIFLTNQGNAVFAVTRSSNPDSPTWTAVADDFDLDGKLELAMLHIQNGLDRVIAIHDRDSENPTVPTVLAWTTSSIFTGMRGMQLASGDVNGDGAPDLVVVRNTEGEVSILLNNGSGAFDPPINITIPDVHLLVHLRIADLDGDGDGDLIAVNEGDYPYYSPDAGSVVLLFNAGGVSFDSPITLTTGSVPKAAATADFDGDGDLDLAVVNADTDDVTILYNMGGHAFVPGSGKIGVGDAPVFLVAADFDGDGDQDIAVANSASNSVSILLNQGGGVFAAKM